MKRNALLFKSGDYTSKGINVTDDMLTKMEENFSEVPIMLEHLPSPLDGHLGKLESIYRKDNELHGTLDIPDGIWEVIDSAESKKLSITFLRDSLKLTEVSITDTPACAEATMFSFSVDLKDSLQTDIDKTEPVKPTEPQVVKFSKLELKKQLEEISFKDVDLYEELRSKLPEDSYIETLSIDSVVYSMFDSIENKWRSFKVSYTINNKTITLLEDKVEVTWDWVETFSKKDKNSKGESNENMDNTNEPNVDNANLKFSEEVKAEIAEQKLELQKQTAEFSKKLEERDAQIKALTDINKRASIETIAFKAVEGGQCSPAQKGILEEILFNASAEPISFNDEKTDLFGLVIKFISENKVPVNFSTGKKVDNDVSTSESEEKVLSMSEKNYCKEHGISEETYLLGKTAQSDTIDLSKGDN